MSWLEEKQHNLSQVFPLVPCVSPYVVCFSFLQFPLAAVDLSLHARKYYIRAFYYHFDRSGTGWGSPLI